MPTGSAPPRLPCACPSANVALVTAVLPVLACLLRLWERELCARLTTRDAASSPLPSLLVYTLVLTLPAAVRLVP